MRRQSPDVRAGRRNRRFRFNTRSIALCIAGEKAVPAIRRPPGAQPTHAPCVDDRQRQPRTAMLERSEEHTSELQSLMRISYAVFCLKKKNKTKQTEQQP